MKHKINVNMNGSYKLGMHEVVGLKEAIAEVMQPIVECINDRTYWNNSLKLEDVEYKSRDGFIANRDNCGGLMIDLVIPKCEEYEFCFLEFGECDEPDCEEECSMNSEGLLDARLRIWFKFEGINDDGELEFYINACGGNGDAPYFRVGNLSDLFEASFTCKSVKGLKRAASKHIKALLKVIK